MKFYDYIRSFTLCYLCLTSFRILSETKMLYCEKIIIAFTIIILAIILLQIKKKLKLSNDTLFEQAQSYCATLNHDLKTPAIAQIRALELLINEKSGPLNDKQKEIIELTLSSCRYLYRMIYTEIATYNFEAKNQELCYSNFDLIKVIKECISETKKLSDFESKTINLETQYAYCLIRADRHELKTVISNLLLNGILYAHKVKNINVTLRIENNNVVLKIHTTGPYIPPQEIKTFFQKNTTNSAKFHKIGMGQGLYLSKKIIEAHKGSVIAISLKENSNIFGFQIPLQKMA